MTSFFIIFIPPRSCRTLWQREKGSATYIEEGVLTLQRAEDGFLPCVPRTANIRMEKESKRLRERKRRGRQQVRKRGEEFTQEGNCGYQTA